MNIPLNVDQTAFLYEMNARLGFEYNLNKDFKLIASMIEDNGGCREIYRTEDDGTKVLYLKRYYLYRGLEREAMLHQFFLGDKGSLHDHPADSWGRILDVGYYERLCTHISPNGRTEGEYEVDREPGEWSYRPGSVTGHDNYQGFHKVKLRKSEDAGKVWTFFVMEKRNEHSWGWRENNGVFVPVADNHKADAEQFGNGWFLKRIK